MSRPKLVLLGSASKLPASNPRPDSCDAFVLSFGEIFAFCALGAILSRTRFKLAWRLSLAFCRLGTRTGFSGSPGGKRIVRVVVKMEEIDATPNYVNCPRVSGFACTGIRNSREADAGWPFMKNVTWN